MGVEQRQLAELVGVSQAHIAKIEKESVDPRLSTVNKILKVLTEGVHSGAASGIVPSSFRIARQLLSRIEDDETGAMTLQPLFVDIPPERIEQARRDFRINAGLRTGDHLFVKEILRHLDGRCRP